jgi:hypothetical protein
MAVRFPDVVTIRRQRDAGRDRRGNPKREQAYAVEVFGFLTTASSRVLPLDPTVPQLFASDTVVLLPAGTDVRAGDRVEVDGERFVVDGDPVRVRAPIGARVRHIEAKLLTTTDAVLAPQAGA